MSVVAFCQAFATIYVIFALVTFLSVACRTRDLTLAVIMGALWPNFLLAGEGGIES